MITTTLAQLPNSRPYEAVGVVMGIANVSTRHVTQGSSEEAVARQRMEAQAEGMGADAIIDVHLQIEAVNHQAGDATLAVALIGTAIKFIQMR